MKTIMLVVDKHDFRDEEYQEPKEILEKAGFKVITASTVTQEIEGKLGLRITPDIYVKDISVNQLDALIFIGGGGSSQYFEDPLAHDLANQAFKLGKIVGAICIAPIILGNAGLLKGKKAIVYPDGADILKKQGAIYTGNPVDVDGKIITGNGPDADLYKTRRAIGEVTIALLLLLYYTLAIFLVWLDFLHGSLHS